MVKFYKFHGIKIKLSSTIPSIFGIFEKTFGIKPSVQQNYKTHIRLNFFHKNSLARINLPKESKEKIHLERERNVKGLYDGKRLFLTDGKSIIKIDYNEGNALFSIDPSTLKLKKLFSHTLLPLSLAELMKKFGFYYAHASCAEINGKGILFFGEGGSGKSTACYSLVRKGSKWVSDDAVLLKRNGKNIIAHSFIKEFDLKTGQESNFRELTTIRSSENGKTDLQNVPKIACSFIDKTIPKLVIILNYKERGITSFREARISDLIGSIIKENEFIFLNREYSDNILENLISLAKQCDLKYFQNKKLVSSSGKFKNNILKILG